ncbi:MAG TPA: iron-containing alcohol dehydrogenase [Kofleriaceae bacterium]|nr:iron-containing alcohol dehydrogenase [Kofleriaceae bacterium]
MGEGELPAVEVLAREPDRVVFGAGAERLTAGLLAELGARRVLLVAQARHTDGAERVAAALGARAAGVFTTDVPQVPAEVASAAAARARELDVDWVLAHGGGTPMGIAKAIALELPVLLAAVPTTYAGSERTDIWGINQDGRRTTGRDPRVRPRLVVYDPTLTVGLDRATSLDSLFNALAHSVEALYAADATADARGAALGSLEPLVAGIRAVAGAPDDLGGRTLALRGSALAATSLGGASMGLHHKLAHVLGALGAPHARTHALLLPYTFGFNAPAAVDAVRALHRAWGADDPPGFLYDLQRSLGLATSLRTLGITAEQARTIADEVLHLRYPNPRPIDREALLALLDDALHDRRPSLRTRRLAMPAGATGPHAPVAVTVRGAPVERARAVLLALHGRGASADRFAAELERRLGPRDDVAIVAPQAADNTWYPKPFTAPPDDNQPWLASALSVVEALWRHLADAAGAERVIVAGFSQGACLALTWLSQTASRPRQVLAWSGAPTSLPGADCAAARGVELYLGTAAGDPWVSRELVEAGAARFTAAGARVELSLVAGDVHGIHPPDELALRRAVERAAGGGLAYQAGYGNALASEARPGALPRAQNSPRRVPYGLVAEQVNGTGFTVRRADNRRTWMYRLRPQVVDRPFRARAHGSFVGDFGAGIPTPELLGYRPLELPAAPTDFLSSLTTFAGAGDASLGRGAAIHLYAATADMERTAFCDVDGDLVVVPERGRLHVQTELGRLDVAPGELVILPRGLRFRVALPDGAGRGFVAEVFDGHLALPERGPIGANGLADERHFLAPTAAFEDDARPWTIVVRQGGRLWEVDAPHGPFDVVAWHGRYAPFKYDLMAFNSLGSVSFDHADPSIMTVLTCPLDGQGRNALDIGVFRGRWDVAEHTFRPPFFHRNAASEFNGVLRSPAGSRWSPGGFTYTPYLTPHAISARGYEATVTAPDDVADRPERLTEDSLWIQFESAYGLKVMPWMLEHPARDREHLAAFADYRPRAIVP